MPTLLLTVFAALFAGAGIGFFLARGKQAAQAAHAEALARQLEQAQQEAAAARERESAQREQVAALRVHAAQAETLRVEAEAGRKARERAEALQAGLDAEKQLSSRLDRELELLKVRMGDLLMEHEGLQRSLAQAETALKAERAQGEEKLAVLNDARAELSNQFKALAGEILEEKARRFTEQNQVNLGQILDPLKTRLTEFQSKVEEVQKEGIAGRSELRTHIDQLKSLNERLSQDASNLVSALKGSSKTQGDWGEFILESILEGCGLRKGEQYRVQESYSYTEDDPRRRARPDVILDLPEGKHLVIDAKVSLLDYNTYCSCEAEQDREAALGRHLASVRTHLKGLSERNYQSLYGLKTLDFVVMFVPVEPAFMLAISRDNRLWQDAWNSNVLLVSPSTLLFVVRTVSQLWRQESQARNVQEIVRRGGELYDKLAGFAKDLVGVGKSLEMARENYDNAFRKLKSGRGNAIRQAEMLKSLGVKPTRPMPLGVIEEALDESMDTVPSESLSFPEPPPPAELESPEPGAPESADPQPAEEIFTSGRT